MSPPTTDPGLLLGISYITSKYHPIRSLSVSVWSLSVMVQSSAVGLRVYGWSLDGVPARMDVLGLRTVLMMDVVVFTLCG